MKKWVRLAFVVALCRPSLWAVDWKELKQQGYVSDYADLIDQASRSQLNAYCASIERATGAQMALVTIRTLQGEPVEDVAQAIFRAWGTGQNGKAGGILLLLAIGERRSSLAMDPRLARVLPDGLHDSILREMRPAIRHDQYGQALVAAADQIGSSVARAMHVSAPPRLPLRFRPGLWDILPWPLWIGGIAFLFGLPIWLMRSGGARSHCGRGRSSGGFGGPDSGDGFAGFGGGDSGRGRTSDAW